MNCKSCGTSNPEGAIFCRKCGEKLKEDGNNGWLKTIAWLFAIGVIGCVIALIFNNQSSYRPTPSTPSDSQEIAASYLNVSDDFLFFAKDGGSISISITTDGEWEIVEDVADWVTISKTSSSITVRVEPYERGERKDYFTIVADTLYKRVDILQADTLNYY